MFDDSLRHSVAFLVQDKGVGLAPMASAFFVSVKVEDFLACYVVTATHNIEHASASGKELFLRYNTASGEYDHLQIKYEDCVMHHDSDVCIFPLNLPSNIYASYCPSDILLSAEQLVQFPLLEGTQICMTSLFQPAPGKKSIQPVNRYGHLSVLPKERVAINIGDHQRQKEVEGYLIETLSWGGCSGSPVFLRHEVSLSTSAQADLKPVWMMGVLVAHYDYYRPVPKRKRGKRRKIVEVPVNSGLAVVIPAQKILDLLEIQEIRDERLARRKAHLQNEIPNIAQE